MRRKSVYKIVSTAFATVGMIATLPSCERVYEGEGDCPQGASLQFVYDYNMEYANAFPSKVDCLTLYVYDSSGNCLQTLTETSPVLGDESYRMSLDLEKGSYHTVAYGGTACPNATFAPVSAPAKGSKVTDLSIALSYSGFNGGTSSAQLHDLFYGEGDFTVSSGKVTDVAVRLKKNTNNIRIILQDVSGETLYAEDFSFEITDDNTLFDCQNNIVSNGTVTYTPWVKGEYAVTDDVAFSATKADDDGVAVVFAEISTSRLVTSNSPRLVITNNGTGDATVSLPLNDYLTMYKSEAYSSMDSQEFLDRQSDWAMTLFLTGGDSWMNTHIIINGWTIRLNDVGM